MITTAGPHFLDELGAFPTIEQMTRTGSATVVLASGARTDATVERIPSAPAPRLCSSGRWGKVGVWGLRRGRWGRGMVGPVGRSRGEGCVDMGRGM